MSTRPAEGAPPPDRRAVRERARAAGQEHVFAFWDELDDVARARLVEQVARVDFELVAELARQLAEGAAPALEADPEPPALFPLERDAAHDARAREARGRGEELLAAGKVGYLLVAGGQASRLGYDGPKGRYPIGPLSRRSLFELHARRLRAARRRHGCATPWCVMTSRQNDGPTRAFFAEHGWFGVPREDVLFFAQDMVPALDDGGRILMAAKDQLFLAPNGHGGSLSALAKSGALEQLAARGVEHLSYFQVDNPLVRPADPLFLGLHALAGAGMSSKVVEKKDPAEKVGVVAGRGGRLGIVEYSDLPDELRHARDGGGKLLFRAGNIAVHVLDLAFVRELTAGGLDLPWHLARKRMKVVGEDGRPAETFGTKFETFVFDALSRSPASVTLEVARESEFSPVKNAEGADSPDTARRDLVRLFAGMASAAGLPAPPRSPDGLPLIEIDPLLAEDERELAARAPLAPRSRGGGHLYEAD